MEAKFHSSKIQRYLSKRSHRGSFEDSLLLSATEKTRSQIEEIKSKRKLPLLGMNWHRIKDKSINRKERLDSRSFSIAYNKEDLDYDKFSDDIRIYQRKNTSQSYKSGTDTSSRDGKHYPRIQQTYHTSDEQPQKSSPISKISAPVHKISDDFSLSSKDGNIDSGNQSYSVSRKVTYEVHSKHPHKTNQSSNANLEYSFSNTEKKSRSNSVPSRKLGILKPRKLTVDGNANHNRTPVKSDMKLLNPNPFVLHIRPTNETENSTQNSPSVSLTQEAKAFLTTFTLSDFNITIPSPSCGVQEEFKEKQIELIKDEKSQALGGKVFQNKDVCMSKLPMSVIEHPNLPKIKALQGNRVLAGRPLQLPLSNAIENILKDIDTKMKKSKHTPLEEFEENLLRENFVDYFKELNPLGRLNNDELTMLNDLNDLFRSKRGLSVGSNHGFQKNFIDKSPEHKADRKAQVLLQKLREAQQTNGNPEDVIKEYRKDLPHELSRKFLELSFGSKLKNLNDNSSKKLKILNKASNLLNECFKKTSSFANSKEITLYKN